MSNLQIYGIIMGSILVICLAIFVSYMVGAVEWKRHYEEEIRHREALRKILDEKDEELRTFQNLFAQNVEVEAQKRMRDWRPDENDVYKDFDLAVEVTEYMRKNRDMRDAGRNHPPREDSGGEPAKITRLQIRR